MPVSRRVLLTGAGGALLVAGTAVAGCTPPWLPPVQTPPSSQPAPTTSVPPRSVVVGIDGTVTGFNPHAIADFSPVTMAVAALVLPSAFRIDSVGGLEPDPALLDSAEVTSADPFTVTYALTRAASWSDGTPITGEDFNYLREQLSTAAGTVDPAGYRLISEVRSRQGGKVVDVQFIRRFPAWRTLFGKLLPAHILKDAPGGWAGGLAAGLPVSGSRYKMASVDTVTGEITLQRNDKFWGTGSGPESVVLRLGSTADLLAALSRGDLQAAELRPTPADTTAMVAVSADRTAVVPLPAVTQLVFNTVAGPASEVAVRRAICQAVDPEAIRRVLAGWGSGDGPAGQTGAGSPPRTELPVNSMVSLAATAPLPAAGGPAGTAATGMATTGTAATDMATTGAAATGTTPTGTAPAGTTAPGSPVAGHDLAAAAADLTAAGYSLAGLYAIREGKPLVIRIGYPAGNPQLTAGAMEIQRQLGLAGVEVDVVSHSARGLVAAMADGTLDAAVMIIPRGPEDAVSAASQFGCPPADAPADAPRTGNLSGLCTAPVQQLLDAAMAGSAPISALEPPLVEARPVLPLAQPAVVFVAPTGTALPDRRGGVDWVFRSPLNDVAQWPVH